MNGSKCMKRMYETKKNERENRRALNSSRKYMLKVREKKYLATDRWNACKKKAYGIFVRLSAFIEIPFCSVQC